MKPDARDRLIEGTRELLWERGYVGTSPTAILARSGVGQGSLYHHFAGKPDLALAAEQRSAELMQQQIVETFAREGTALERISGFLGRERDVLRGCSVGRLTADPDVMADDVLREPIRETFEVLHEHLRRTIAEGVAAGEFADDLDTDEIASTIAAVVQGGYALARAAQAVEPFDNAVRGVLSLLRACAPQTR
jgi:AcrR family transcriptional regulator